MSINNVYDIAPVDGSKYYGTTPTEAKSDLNMATFMKLLTAQLANQNPLEPMKDSDFFAQVAQLGQVQGMDSLKSSMEVTQATAMIGRTVTAVRPMTDSTDGTNQLITGKVVRMSVKNGENILGVQDTDGGVVDIKFANIREIK